MNFKPMNRDEINKALNLKQDVQNEKGKQFRIITSGNYYGQENTHTFLIAFRKIKGEKLGRIRVMDLISFSKTHQVVSNETPTN